jgi:hypothetical protein
VVILPTGDEIPNTRGRTYSEAIDAFLQLPESKSHPSAAKGRAAWPTHKRRDDLRVVRKEYAAEPVKPIKPLAQRLPDENPRSPEPVEEMLR